jgi:hypothetical protein
MASNFQQRSESLVLKFWPKIGTSGAILITTRDPFFAQPDIASDGQELLQLNEESAITLVRSSVPRPTGDFQSRCPKAREESRMHAFGSPNVYWAND